MIEFCIHEIHVVCNVYALEFKPGKPTEGHQIVYVFVMKSEGSQKSETDYIFWTFF